MVQQAQDRVQQLLAQHTVEALPAAMEAELERIIRDVEQREAKGG
jgi:hypothetical protein